MRHEPSRIGKSRQSRSARKEKMANSALLAAVSILSISLGFTAAQAAVEVTAAGGSSTHYFSTKLAETKIQSQVKTNPPVSQKPLSKGINIEQKRPDSFTPPKSPQEKPKR